VVPDRRRHAAIKIGGEKQRREADELSRGWWVGQSERGLSARGTYHQSTWSRLGALMVLFT
jgi:hypothetical protein